MVEDETCDVASTQARWRHATALVFKTHNHFPRAQGFVKLCIEWCRKNKLKKAKHFQDYRTTKNTMDWMGSKSAYKGPTLTERKQLRKASVRSFYIRTSISTSKMDLRTVFEAAGCVVTDVRVVFDGTQSTGVAYCDVADDESIEKGLTLDATELNEAPLRVRRNLNKDSLRNLVKERDSAGGNSTEKQTCYAFKNGTCKRGDECKFSHGPAAANKSGSEPAKTTVRVCYNFLKGKCDRGAHCKFAHSKDETRSKEAPADGAIPICQNFLKGRCTRPGCKFLHRQPAETSDTRKRPRDDAASLDETGAVASSSSWKAEGTEGGGAAHEGGESSTTDPGGTKGSGKSVGLVKRWNNERGFGFISPDAGGEDIFCHVNNITDGNALQEGSKVTYDQVVDDRSGKMRADNVAGGCGERRADTRGGGGSGAGASPKKKQKKDTKWTAPELPPAEMREVQSLLRRRQDARDAKNWADADKYRNQLKEKGITVTDTKQGPIWKIKGGSK